MKYLFAERIVRNYLWPMSDQTFGIKPISALNVLLCHGALL